MRLHHQERGNALIEFALAVGILVAVMAGVFQYGYTFYVYNQLQTSIRAATRYGATRTYTARSTSCIDAVVDSVQNVAVYGSPVMDDATTPIVRGLTKQQIAVDYHPDAKGVPAYLTVNVSNFTVDAIFTTFTFNGKPFASMPYVGRYAPNQCN